MDLISDTDITEKKKRGRKPKIVDVDVVDTELKEKKKRGRKPKVIDPNEIQNPQRVRKRGRRPKCPVKSISEIREKFNNDNDKIMIDDCRDIINENHSQTHVPFGNLNIIVHKPPEIDTTKLREFYNNKDSRELGSELGDELDIDHHQSESESEIERIPIKYCSRCDVGDKEELVKVEKKKVNKQLYKFSTKLDECGKWPLVSNSLCWWCCHSFNTVPIPSVISYEERRNRYSLKGIFCSWECSYSFTFDKNPKHMGYLSKLFKEWTGKRKMDVVGAPPHYVLKAFGGHMDITEFRKSPYIDRKVFLSENNRMSYVNQDILEIYTEMEKKKIKKMNISRRKPLKSTETLFENMILN